MFYKIIIDSRLIPSQLELGSNRIMKKTHSKGGTKKEETKHRTHSKRITRREKN